MARTSNRVTIPCGNCGAPLQRYASQVKHKQNVFCNRTCQGAWRSKQTGPKAPHWKGGSRVSAGRTYYHLPWHPLADHKGYVARYIIVAELKLGRPLVKGEVVHHEDEDYTNDHPDNLRVFASQAEHARYHGLQRSAEQMAAMRAARGSSNAGE